MDKPNREDFIMNKGGSGEFVDYWRYAKKLEQYIDFQERNNIKEEYIPDIVVPNLMNDRNRIIIRVMTYISEDAQEGNPAKEIFKELASLLEEQECNKCLETGKIPFHLCNDGSVLEDDCECKREQEAISNTETTEEEQPKDKSSFQENIDNYIGDFKKDYPNYCVKCDIVLLKSGGCDLKEHCEVVMKQPKEDVTLKCFNNGNQAFKFTVGKDYQFTYSINLQGWSTINDFGNKETFFDTKMLFKPL